MGPALLNKITKISCRLSWYLDPLSPHHLKMFIKQEVKFGPPMTKLSGSAHVKDWTILEP